jgi:AcrR family transcriptional regulator
MTVLRADAERNRGLILEAARSVFAEHGAEAGVAEVAERAGVGVATIFRRFPTKDDLLAAILEDRLREIVELARNAASFREFMVGATAVHMGDRCLCDAVGGDMFARPEHELGRREVRTIVGGLLERAQRDGEVRIDLTVDDIPVVLLGVARAAPQESWRRYLDFALDGLRPTGSHPRVAATAP